MVILSLYLRELRWLRSYCLTWAVPSSSNLGGTVRSQILKWTQMVWLERNEQRKPLVQPSYTSIPRAGLPPLGSRAYCRKTKAPWNKNCPEGEVPGMLPSPQLPAEGSTQPLCKHLQRAKCHTQRWIWPGPHGPGQRGPEGQGGCLWSPPHPLPPSAMRL